jgi:hypothetical protein
MQKKMSFFVIIKEKRSQRRYSPDGGTHTRINIVVILNTSQNMRVQETHIALYI